MHVATPCHSSLSVPSWDTLAWPRHIEDQVEQTEGQLEQDEQKFHKKLLDDEAQLEDKLDNLQVCRLWWKVSSLAAKLHASEFSPLGLRI